MDIQPLRLKHLHCDDLHIILSFPAVQIYVCWLGNFESETLWEWTIRFVFCCCCCFFFSMGFSLFDSRHNHCVTWEIGIIPRFWETPHLPLPSVSKLSQVAVVTYFVI